MPRRSKRSNIIRVPAPSPVSYNKHRPVSSLLRGQMMHLREALQKHLEEFLALDLNLIRTEGEASEYIHRATRILHPQGAAHVTRSEHPPKRRTARKQRRPLG